MRVGAERDVRQADMDKPSHKDLTHPSGAPAVMIFGGGVCARKIAVNLTDYGLDAWLAAADTPLDGDESPGGARWLQGAELIHSRGFAGQFGLQLRIGQERIDQTVRAIVVADDHRQTANFNAYGLTPGPGLMAISALEAILQAADSELPFTGNTTVVFLCGWQIETHPSVSKRMLDACCQLQQQRGVATYFMTGNLNVSASGAEARVQEAKGCGTVFLKFSDGDPTIITTDADHRFGIACVDELTRIPVRLGVDWIVVDETVGPAAHLPALAQHLGIDPDGSGFAQGDNVRLMSHTTNRRGIFAAGGARGVFATDQQMADADQVSLAVLAFLQDRDRPHLPAVTIQRNHCVRCLTCYRLCPHAAIAIGPPVTVDAAACQACGICLAGCPAHAIETTGTQIENQIDRVCRPPAITDEKAVPDSRILVLGCARSAGSAFAQAQQMGRRLPVGVRFVEVPCGGSIASRHLLAAFESGVDGVMVCPCHNGNCRSDNGCRLAHQRADSVRQLLIAAGVNGERLRLVPLAANMDAEFAAVVDAFATDIQNLDSA